MNTYAPFVRIFLRYALGAIFVGAAPLGEQLAADPDVIAAASVAAGMIVEGFYWVARRKGGAT